MMWLSVIGKALSSVGKLGYMYVQCIFTKKEAVRQFERELMRMDLPLEVVKRLTADYADMVNLNPLEYAKSAMRRSY